MNKMKRFTAIAAGLALCLGAGACGIGHGTQETTADKPTPSVYNEDPSTHAQIKGRVMLTMDGIPECAAWDGADIEGRNGGDWEHLCYWDKHDGSPAYLLSDGVQIATWRR